MNWYLEVLKKYAVFSGRAGRAEFWYFVLFNAIVLVLLGIGGRVGVTAFSVLAILYMLAMLIPGLAVSVRRLHDTGRSGLWLFISLVPFIGTILLLIILASASKEGIDQYAPSPKLSVPVRQELLKDIENAKRDLDILTKCKTRDEIIDGLTQIATLIGQETDDPSAKEFASTVLRSAQSLTDSPPLSDEMISQFKDQHIEIFKHRYNEYHSLLSDGKIREYSQKAAIVTEALDKTEVTTQEEPASGSRLYLWVISHNKQPSKKLLKAVMDHYGVEGDVILGGHRTDDPLPREADDYVVITCLRVCKENDIDFDSARDSIAYSVDIVDDEEIGVCQIRVQVEKANGVAGTKVVEPSQSEREKESKIEEQQPKFIRTERTGNNTYEIYSGIDAQSARSFLLAKQVNDKLFYIVVETPEGSWGMDINGLYLERLLPWQTNLRSAECKGYIGAMGFSIDDATMAAKGFRDNFIAGIQCGKCEHEWQDGIRYQDSTVVRCPECKTLNIVDSRHIYVVTT